MKFVYATGLLALIALTLPTRKLPKVWVDKIRESAEFEDKLAELVEDAPTLLEIDLVRLDLADAALRQEIERQGIVLHEQRKTGASPGQFRPGPSGARAGSGRGHG